MKNKNRVIFSMSVATELCKKGFKIVKTAKNFKDLTKTVWYFEETDELIAALNEILAAQNKKLI